MSKKNKRSTRVKAHAFDLKREKEEAERRNKRKNPSDQKMQVVSEKKITKGQKVKAGKKRRLKIKKASPATKLKAEQAMEIDSSAG